MSNHSSLVETSRRGILGLMATGLATGTLWPSIGQAQSAAIDLSFPEIPAGKASRVTSADGTKINVNDYGNPAGKPILLVHGFSQSRLSWLKQFTDPMLLARFRIVTLDLRGHGESDKPAGTYAPKNMAEDVQAVVTAMGLVKPAVVGWSLGGVVILDWLALAGPSAASKVMFVDAGYGRSSDANAVNTFGPGILSNLPLMMNDDAAINARGTLNFIKACTHRPLPASELAFALAFNMLATPASRRSTLTGRPKTPEDYDRNLLPAIKAAGVPVIAMTGAHDVIVLPFTAGLIAKASGGSLVSYSESGHMPFWEQATQFNTDLAAFVAA